MELVPGAKDQDSAGFRPAGGRPPAGQRPTGGRHPVPEFPAVPVPLVPVPVPVPPVWPGIGSGFQFLVRFEPFMPGARRAASNGFHLHVSASTQSLRMSVAMTLALNPARY